MPNTKRDKYGEVRRLMMKLLRSLEKKDWIEAKAAWSDVEFALRDAFPPPAEDAISLLHSWADNGWVSPYHSDDDECIRLAAEIESFAQSRVAPWREALEEALPILRHYATDNPKWSSPIINDGAEQDPNGIHALLPQIDALLSDSPAKEATHG